MKHTWKEPLGSDSPTLSNMSLTSLGKGYLLQDITPKFSLCCVKGPALPGMVSLQINPHMVATQRTLTRKLQLSRLHECCVPASNPRERLLCYVISSFSRYYLIRFNTELCFCISIGGTSQGLISMSRREPEYKFIHFTKIGHILHGLDISFNLLKLISPVKFVLGFPAQVPLIGLLIAIRSRFSLSL